MEKKLMNFKTKGMNKDLSVSAFNPEFSFDNRNLRLSTNEGNTLMSWVNEKGTKPITFETSYWKEVGDKKAITGIDGTPMGTAVINNQLVLFTHSNTADHIYCIKYHNKEEGWVKGIELFHGDLGFSTEHPLETLTSYESESIQKVYWVDGVHQPRIINIVKDPSSYYDEDGNPISSTLFDFVQTLKLEEEVTITKINGGGGEFPAGVIQYAFTYFNKNGQESNIFYTSPLHYISYYDRGGAPDEKINAAFKISIKNVDTRFDYVRIYSILRTSLNSVPIAKRIQDVSTKSFSNAPSVTVSESTTVYRNINCPIVIKSELVALEGSAPETYDNTLAIRDSYIRFSGDGEHFYNFQDFNDHYSNTLQYIRYANNNDIKIIYEESDNGLCRYLSTHNFAVVGAGIFGRYVYKIEYSESLKDLQIVIDGKKYTWPEGASSTGDEGASVVYILADGYQDCWGDNEIFTEYTKIKRAVIVFAREEPVDGGGYKTSLVSPAREVFNESDWEIINGSAFIDTNTTGEIIDPTELLYLGGENVVAQTIEQKDNTLFLGNLKVRKPQDLESIRTAIETQTGVSESAPLIDKDSNVVTCVTTRRPYTLVSRGDMAYINTLNCPEVVIDLNNNLVPYQGASCFKSNEYYRLGVQFQDSTGRWSEPCWIGDKKWELTDAYIESEALTSIGPRSDESGGNPNFSSGGIGVLALPEFEYHVSAAIQNSLVGLGYKRVRAVYAQPSNIDRTILCQGIINPTMYRNADRSTNVYAQSSWLYRSTLNYANYNGHLDIDVDNRVAGAVTIASSDTSSYAPCTIYKDEDIDEDSWKNYWHEFEYSSTGRVWMANYRSTEIMGAYNDNDRYKIDNTFGTINSPDIEFGGEVESTALDAYGLKLVGYTNLTDTFGDIDIQTSTPTMGPTGRGFIHRSIKTIGTSALISGNFYEDHIVYADGTTDGKPDYKAMRTDKIPFLWHVCMWHKNGSLNNDINRENQSAKLLKKRISNYRKTGSSIFKSAKDVYYDDMALYNGTESSHIVKVNDHVYQGNVDTVVTPSTYSDFYVVGESICVGDSDSIKDAWTPDFKDLPILKFRQNDIYDIDSNDWVYIAHHKPSYESEEDKCTKEIPNNSWVRWDSLGSDYEKLGDTVSSFGYFRDGVHIKYKSSPHIVADLGDGGKIFTLSTDAGYTSDAGTLAIVELAKDYNKGTLFGGASNDALQSATWIPCGPPVKLDATQDTVVPYKWGDTYFQRYECLKTYPYTPEDINQVVEIGSFMLETRVNMDGRYDRNRAQTSNLNATPQNFNLINPVYSQQDNFFNYKILPKDLNSNGGFSNQITWTKTKESGSDVDTWTNITLASTLELDGSSGQINKLIRFNDQLIVFQDTGISQIIYNEQQLATTEGVPVEIANSGKVTGKRYFSNTIGCSNKWSMTTTPNGIYFMDSYGKSIYLFNGEITSLSDKYGFNSWCKKEIPSATVKWCPSYIEDNEEKGFDNFVTYYDRINQDVLFINNDEALAFSEKIGNFTSFYDYGNVPYFCNLEDTGVWITKTGELWMHQAGEYCKFFDENKPYSITLVGNPEPQTDKIFTNLEFRASVEGDGEYIENTGKFTPTLPFNSIEVWNDYQHGEATLNNKSGYDLFKHHTGNDTLKRKFRIWRCDIPRDDKRPMDRMRNSWIYLKLKKNMAEEDSLPKAEIHDLVMTYYN